MMRLAHLTWDRSESTKTQQAPSMYMYISNLPADRNRRKNLSTSCKPRKRGVSAQALRQPIRATHAVCAYVRCGVDSRYLSHWPTVSACAAGDDTLIAVIHTLTAVTHIFWSTWQLGFTRAQSATNARLISLFIYARAMLTMQNTCDTDDIRRRRRSTPKALRG